MRLVLVEDHKLVREALCSILEEEPDITVVGQAGDGESALELCRKLRPDVVLMDIALPGLSGIEVTRRLVAQEPAPHVLALTTYIERRFVTQMREAGAIGYIHKGADKHELLQGIRAVAAGTPYVSQNIAAMLVRSSVHPDTGGNNHELTKRETEVLQLIASGQSSAQIATKLFISVSTVEVHRYNLMCKLQLHSVADLTKYAIREGLVSS